MRIKYRNFFYGAWRQSGEPKETMRSIRIDDDAQLTAGTILRCLQVHDATENDAFCDGLGSEKNSRQYVRNRLEIEKTPAFSDRDCIHHTRAIVIRRPINLQQLDTPDVEVMLKGGDTNAAVA